MNSLSAIALALAEGTAQLELDQWLHIPLDERCELRLLRAARPPGVIAVLARRPLHRTEAEEEAALAALLRLGAETRWTDGLRGGVDDDGWDCIALTLKDTDCAGDVEAALCRLLERSLAVSLQDEKAPWGLP